MHACMTAAAQIIGYMAENTVNAAKLAPCCCSTHRFMLHACMQTTGQSTDKLNLRALQAVIKRQGMLAMVSS
jgi:hypothetical protein